MRKTIYLTIIAALAVLSLGSPGAFADSLTISLDSPISGVAGSSIDVFATITNNTSETIFLNGDEFNALPLLLLDDTNFYFNAPLFLAADSNSGSFDMFTIAIDPSAGPGTISPNTFVVKGGGDGNAQDPLGTLTFDVNVQGVTPVPEPALGGLLAIGLLFSLGVAGRERLRTAARY
jgi:hypothetical protein